MNAIYIEVEAGCRYWEDGSINGQEDAEGKMPHRREDYWCPVIRLADGVVMDWPADTEADIHYKVCDDGSYYLLNENRERIGKWAGYYVPDDILCPGTNGYGDYIILKIDRNGSIANWTPPAIEWLGADSDDDEQYGFRKLEQKESQQ
ncbi:hypothetical protein FEE59_13565 [Herbaspirillum sp. RU 5E]|nr:hypothetical protein [Herbaspirillum sp. RU 5E]